MVHVRSTSKGWEESEQNQDLDWGSAGLDLQGSSADLGFVFWLLY